MNSFVFHSNEIATIFSTKKSRNDSNFFRLPENPKFNGAYNAKMHFIFINHFNSFSGSLYNADGNA
ncbi:MAG: hypothetical protein IJ187_11120 [Neisseriaceae bacterium]|nr:hypothetical protein [Neisseriaceae bacterium]